MRWLVSKLQLWTNSLAVNISFSLKRNWFSTFYPLEKHLLSLSWHWSHLVFYSFYLEPRALTHLLLFFYILLLSLLVSSPLVLAITFSGLSSVLAVSSSLLAILRCYMASCFLCHYVNSQYVSYTFKAFKLTLRLFTIDWPTDGLTDWQNNIVSSWTKKYVQGVF